MRKYREYSNDDIINNAKSVYSIAGLLKSLGLKPVGGNYINIKRVIQKLNINTDHWTGQGWNNGKKLKNWSDYTRVSSLKKHLLKEKSHKCECCDLTHWLYNPIPLEVHHVDGDRTNNDLSNLKLLCCNCHANTDFWRNKRKK